MSYKAENQIITIYYINPEFYQDSLWAQYHEGPYRPVATMGDNLVFHYKYSGKTGQYQLQIPSDISPQQKYYYSVSRSKGYFCPEVINAYKITISGTETHTYSLPLRAARYNPEIDDGNGNFIYLVAVNKGHYDKPNEDNLVFAGFTTMAYVFLAYIAS